MSKSHKDPRSRIELTDTDDEILEKIKKSVTDCTSAVEYDPENRPGVSNLIALHALSSGKTFQQVCEENTHLDTGQYKRIVADAIIEKLRPIREELNKLMDSQDYLEDVLEEGSLKAAAVAEPTWLEVKQKVGLITHPLRRRKDATSLLS